MKRKAARSKKVPAAQQSLSFRARRRKRGNVSVLPLTGRGEIVVDLFAGGGGASEGIRMALGRDPDVAVNHDREAVAMHLVNHSGSRHYCEDVFDVAPRRVCQGRPVGMLWASPDCTHHSKARGGKPFRDRNKARRRRGLAGVILKWAAEVRPRIILMENVEEWLSWGPLGRDGRPDPKKKGTSFQRWAARLRNLGYVVEWRELRACDFGAPTTRKRLFVIARSDGQPIAWPEPTHGPGRIPYRTAAECIDWSLPCPSIFDRKKPLAEKTLARIARGIVRFVIESPKPFVVPVTHGRVNDSAPHSVDEPLRTVTGAHRGELALVAPSLGHYHAPTSEGGHRVGSVEDPLPVQDTANRHAVVAPVLVRSDMHQSNAGCAYSIEEPARTLTTGGGLALVGGALVQTGYGERPGQAPRALDPQQPLGTIIAGGTGGNGKHAVVAAYLAKHFGDPERVTGGGRVLGKEVDEPASTVTARDHQSLVTAHMLKLKGTCRDGQEMDRPAPTAMAGGTHLAEVRAFLTKYYGTGVGQHTREPMGTVTTRDRFGIVTIEGEPYEIADIGMRMLSPRELFNAQGFRNDYMIDPVVEVQLKTARAKRVTRKRPVKAKRFRPLTKTAQIRMCGNSVCPPMAAALVRANVVLNGERVAA